MFLEWKKKKKQLEITNHHNNAINGVKQISLSYVIN